MKRFKRTIRQNFEIFLRFTHRCWFHEVADQVQAKALSDFLEALSDERLGTSAKFRALLAVWRRPSRAPRERT